ncbi:MarR family transcriptional regulator [Zobellia amurskyensis]|uniref:MarR family transcriptional regulator n=1 Tax=Zobellia amurskyensis TaxID=248905 RepID=A0A7X2ZTK9_9FLAO|nr:MarR family transcriptional regulator [Zobellia amurskyensis]
MLVIKAEQYNSSSRLISATERVLTAHLQLAFQENGIDITIEQWRILFYLWKEDGINQQELAKRAKKEKSTMTRQIDTLEKKGLLIRRCLDEDKRNKQIFLTKQGQALEEEALQVANNITQKSETDIDPSDLALFKTVLQKIIENLE